MLKKNKETIVVSFLIVCSFLIVLFFFDQNQKIKILYFTNPTCKIANDTDKIINELKEKFGDRLIVEEITVSMYSGDEPDDPKIKKLRETYNVQGVPTIIINGKEFTKPFTKNNLKEAVCREFLIKPKVCR